MKRPGKVLSCSLFILFWFELYHYQHNFQKQTKKSPQIDSVFQILCFSHVFKSVSLFCLADWLFDYCFTLYCILSFLTVSHQNHKICVLVSVTLKHNYWKVVMFGNFVVYMAFNKLCLNCIFPTQSKQELRNPASPKMTACLNNIGITFLTQKH